MCVFNFRVALFHCYRKGNRSINHSIGLFENSSLKCGSKFHDFSLFYAIKNLFVRQPPVEMCSSVGLLTLFTTQLAATQMTLATNSITFANSASQMNTFQLVNQTTSKFHNCIGECIFLMAWLGLAPWTKISAEYF